MLTVRPWGVTPPPYGQGDPKIPVFFKPSLIICVIIITMWLVGRFGSGEGITHVLSGPGIHTCTTSQLPHHDDHDHGDDSPTSSWRLFWPLDFVLHTFRALRLCDPRKGEKTLLFHLHIMPVSMMHISIMH